MVLENWKDGKIKLWNVAIDWPSMAGIGADYFVIPGFQSVKQSHGSRTSVYWTVDTLNQHVT
jgi:hypothetical protein